jgi:large subunit ribosomal protein L30
MTWMIVRVRGTIHARHDVVETLRYLHLSRPNHATVLPEDANVRGMLTKVQGYVTWGEADPETVSLLIQERGETLAGERVGATAAGGKEPTPPLPELTRTVAEQGLLRASGLKPLFRLKAPKGGWRSTKKPYTLGGALGYRGRAVNDLVRKMI